MQILPSVCGLNADGYYVQPCFTVISNSNWLDQARIKQREGITAWPYLLFSEPTEVLDTIGCGDVSVLVTCPENPHLSS